MRKGLIFFLLMTLPSCAISQSRVGNCEAWNFAAGKGYTETICSPEQTLVIINPPPRSHVFTIDTEQIPSNDELPPPGWVEFGNLGFPDTNSPEYINCLMNGCRMYKAKDTHIATYSSPPSQSTLSLLFDAAVWIGTKFSKLWAPGL